MLNFLGSLSIAAALEITVLVDVDGFPTVELLFVLLYLA